MSFHQPSTNRKGQADKVIEFLPANSPEADQLNKEYVIIKEKEKPKFLPSKIIEIMQIKGHVNFKMHQHTQLWKAEDAKNKSKGFGTEVAGYWYWYQSWLEKVEEHCNANKDKYANT